MDVLPIENLIAFHPSGAEIGGLRLPPLTLDAAVTLGSLGIDAAAGRCPTRRAALAALVLLGRLPSGAPAAEVEADALLKDLKTGLNELSKAVGEVFCEAFSTYVPAAKESKVISFTPSGMGWPLAVAEFLCAEYGWSWREAVDTPVATALALVATARARNGRDHGGPDYIERMAIPGIVAAGT